MTTARPPKPRIDPSRSPAAEPAEVRTLWDRARQALLLAAIMFSSLGLYLLVLRWRGEAVVFVTHTPWDDYFPFHPEWVWVYLLPYLIGPVVIGLLSRQTFRWFVQRGLAVVFLTLLIFIVLPTQVAKRPPANHLGEGLTARLYQQMIAIDEPPANAAPSLHVSLTCLLAFALVRDFPRWWPLSLGCVMLVWFSTLVTRQHHLIDVGTGAALACLVVLAWPPLRRKPQGGET
jgi:membrane-associated phospholipid phosphatase